MTDETIFAEALAKADPAERTAYLDGACGGDEDLRRKVERLLAAHDRAGGFLDRTAVPPTQAPTGVYDSKADATGDDDALGLLAPPQRPDSLGRIGHYEVLEVLGRGGFGVVYRAFDDVLQRVVAVKVLSPQMAATSPARKRFLREARAAGAVRHENVVQIHATGESPLPYLVMEYVPGETLQQHLDRTGPLDVAEVLRVGRQIADGLAAAHAQGLVHRDVKPANVLIEGGPQAKVKLTDFGLARAADDASISQSGVVAGTPMYMAPEQAKGEPLDHRADLFSLGSVLYAMCSGRPPFRANSTLAVLKRVAEDHPRPIREIIPEVPDWLCRVIEKLHAKNPADRYQSAREVADTLSDCERQLAAHAKVTNLARIPPRPPDLRSSRPWSAGRVVFVLAVAALAGVIGLVVSLATAYLSMSLPPAAPPAQLAINWEGKDLVVTVRGEGGLEYVNEGWSKGVGMELRPGTYTVRAQRGGEVVFEQRVRLGPGEHAGVEIPGPPVLTAPLDLVPLARPRPDLGTWRREGASLVCGPRPGGDRTLQVLPLPVELPTEYDFLAEFERVSGNDLIGFNLTAGGVGFCVVIDAWPSAGYRSGLSPLDGKDAFETDAGVKGRLLATGTRHTFRCAVRAGGVTATLDGKPVVTFAGPLDRIDGRFLAYAETRNYLKVLGTDGFTVHRLRVSPPSPSAGPLREAVTAREKARDAVKLRYEAGVLPVTDLHAADFDLAAARLKVAEAEGDDEGVAARLKEMFAAARGIRDAVAERVEAGVEGPVKLAEAQIRLADVTARLAKAGIPVPPQPAEPAPPPRRVH